MLTHKIKYEDFNGDEQEEVFYFNINKTEMIELEVEHKGGLEVWLDSVTKAEDNKTLFAEFKRIILLAYGEKSEDGKQFVKNDALREKFANHAAFDVLVVQFATDEDALPEFIKAVLPKDLKPAVEKVIAEQKTAAEQKTTEDQKVDGEQKALDTPTNP